MIKLDLTGTATGTFVVSGSRFPSLSKYYRRLRRRPCPRHLRMQANSVEVTQMFGPGNRVPDVDRYRVSARNGRWRVQPHSSCQVDPTHNCFNDLPASCAELESTILLLLESPHRYEYRGGDPRFPVAPAQGRTGRRICKYLECILNAPRNAQVMAGINATARVIIANPVQFQTSLWIIHQAPLRDWSNLRNAVWKTLWDISPIWTDFEDRLRCYHPDVVLNCCTSGLRRHVTDFLTQCGLTARIYEARHPSVWNCSVRLERPRPSGRGRPSFAIP